MRQINQPIVTDQEQKEVEKNFAIMLDNNPDNISITLTNNILDNLDENGYDTSNMRVLTQKKIDYIKSIQPNLRVL